MTDRWSVPRWRTSRCVYCGHVSQDNAESRRHRNTHPKEERTAICPYCDKEFHNNGQAFLTHIDAHDEDHRAATRFWPRVDKNGPVSELRPDLGPCWIWTGPLCRKGYGVVHVHPKTTLPAYKYAYLREVGPVQEGLELDHLCRVTACVNPSHLEPVTHYENMQRSARFHKRVGFPCDDYDFVGRAPGALSSHIRAKHPHNYRPKTRRINGKEVRVEVLIGGDAE